jgi:predicted nucleic acid-binding protein
MYLLDTNVISELRKTRMTDTNPSVANWFEPVEIDSCYLSVVTIQEIETGILLVEKKDQIQATAIRLWFESKVLVDFEDQILPVNIQVARRCAQLHVPKTRSYRDAVIAATAYVHNMSVVTRNVKDFTDTGVEIINPWQP